MGKQNDSCRKKNNCDSVIDMEQPQEVSQQTQSEISETIQQPTDAQMALFGNN